MSAMFFAVLVLLVCEILMLYAFGVRYRNGVRRVTKSSITVFNTRIPYKLGHLYAATIMFGTIHYVAVSTEYLDHDEVFVGYFLIILAEELIVKKKRLPAGSFVTVLICECGYCFHSAAFFGIFIQIPITVEFVLMKNDGMQPLCLLGYIIWNGVNVEQSTNKCKTLCSIVSAVISGSTVVGFLTFTIPVAFTNYLYWVGMVPFFILIIR